MPRLCDGPGVMASAKTSRACGKVTAGVCLRILCILVAVRAGSNARMMFSPCRAMCGAPGEVAEGL